MPLACRAGRKLQPGRGKNMTQRKFSEQAHNISRKIKRPLLKSYFLRVTRNFVTYALHKMASISATVIDMFYMRSDINASLINIFK